MSTLFDDFEARVVQRSSDDLWTPKWVFDALGLTFDLDVCAPIEGPKHTPAAAWYSILDDGLAKPWTGRVWMNPPYSKPTPWVHKWLDHGNGLMLIQTSKARWHDDVWRSDARAVMLPYSMRFDTPSGYTQGIFMPTVIWAIGADNIEALEHSNIGKIR